MDTTKHANTEAILDHTADAIEGANHQIFLHAENARDAIEGDGFRLAEAHILRIERYAGFCRAHKATARTIARLYPVGDPTRARAERIGRRAHTEQKHAEEVARMLRAEVALMPR